MLHAPIFSHNLKFSQKGTLDIHVTAANVGLCMKEVIDSLLRRAPRRKIMDTSKHQS